MMVKMKKDGEDIVASIDDLLKIKKFTFFSSLLMG